MKNLFPLLIIIPLCLVSCSRNKSGMVAETQNQAEAGFPFDLADDTYYSPIESTVDPGGFVIAGSNTSQSIRALTELNGLAISEIELLMRPGDSDPRMSSEGFLGADEKLLDILIEDNDCVFSCGYTHRQLAIPILQLIGLARINRVPVAPNADRFYAEFAYCGINWRVEFFLTDGTQFSPFSDNTDSGSVYTIKNLDNDRTLQIAELVPMMIERYGFYEGHGTSYRVAPSSIIALLGLKSEAD